LWTSITYLCTHHECTVLYPSCTWTMLGTVFINHSSAMDKSLMVSWWSSKTCAVFTCYRSARLKGVNWWWMPTHLWTLCTHSLNDVASGFRHRMRNSRRVLRDVGLNWSVRTL
jgi:hypothetical protein